MSVGKTVSEALVPVGKSMNCCGIQESCPALAFQYILTEGILRQMIKVHNEDTLRKSLANTLGLGRASNNTGENRIDIVAETSHLVQRGVASCSLAGALERGVRSSAHTGLGPRSLKLRFVENLPQQLLYLRDLVYL